MRILDTHLHLIYPERFTYPWLAGAPKLNRPWSIESYWAEARPLGIEAALHMEVDVTETDSEDESNFVVTLPGIVGAVANCRPERVDFVTQVERLCENPGVKGVRRLLHESPDDLSKSKTFVDNIGRLSDYGLTFDLCIRADQLTVGSRLVQSAPDVSFILDHCGIPDVSGAGLDPWRENIRDIARQPNLSAKISGIVAYSGANWTVDTIRPYVEHVIECFGWDRVVWGSDHPVVTLTGSLTRWVEATHEILRGTTEDEQAKLLHRNAEGIYRI